jgi:hypothetical protein
MKNYRQINNLLGWSLFLISTLVYLLTLEPTVSFWDCGEFITASYKLEVGHSPGAPLFMLVARFFSMFAPAREYVAICTNAISAITSALTVMFLFWTMTRLLKRISPRDETAKKQWIIWGASISAAMAFAFTDSFWFSAVEAEVYASSSLLTALVFWTILKWDEVADEPYANRWLILIAYLMGLSIGVHLLNLLTIPALILWVYFRKRKASAKGILLALVTGIGILAAVQFGVIIGIVKLALFAELFAVNNLGMPYNSGASSFFILITILLIAGIWLTQRYQKRLLNILLLSASFLLLGYSSYTVILIRASANPPMNENQPDNLISLLSYLNRDQYADEPLLYGPYYNAPITETRQGKPVYIRQNGRYEVSYHQPEYIYDSRFCTFFPRMYSSDGDHIDFYKSWGNVQGKPIAVTDENGTRTEQCPTFAENLTYFFNYQVYQMYIRYFLWNFCGRQNDLDGNGGLLKGNFLTGLPFIDNALYGKNPPDYLKNNKSRNTYFLIPLILGIIGMFYQAFKHKTDFWVMLILFVMTGLAIVVYLNQTPFQPRERDYAYIGSCYSFAIWIGIGLVAIYQWFKKVGRQLSLTIFLLTAISLPTLLATQNWDDHDRSHRYTARDMAWNYLQSCSKNAILFTDGDNDTYPLWYLQEVEGVRTDIRVVNLSLLNCEWYINQMKRKVNESDPLPISLDSEKYRDGKMDYIYLSDRNPNGMLLSEAVAYAASSSLDNKLQIDSAEYLDMIPTRTFRLDADSTSMLFKIGRSYLSKSTLIVLDILASNKWKRPVYFTSPQGSAMGLDAFLQCEGYTYRLRSAPFDSTWGGIATDSMYSHIMHRFRWGNMNQQNLLIDNFNLRMIAISRLRQNVARLAFELLHEGKKGSAANVITKIVDIMPENAFPYDRYSLELIRAAFEAGAQKQAHQMLEGYTRQCKQSLQYIEGLPQRLSRLMLYEKNTSNKMIGELNKIKEKYVKLTTLKKGEKIR